MARYMNVYDILGPNESKANKNLDCCDSPQYNESQHWSW
jgi:hypothetical protein